MSYSRSRILLDTTYLLPIIGVYVDNVEKPLSIFEKLYRSGAVEIFYTPFSLLEIVDKLSKLKYDKRRVEIGLKAIRSRFKMVTPTTRGYIKALELRGKGFRDLIDLLLYTTSKTRGLLLLTRDAALVEFLKMVGEDTPNIVLEEEFVKTYQS